MLLQNGAAGLLLYPGMGKTSIVLESFRILKEKNLIDKLFVVGPLRVISSAWPQELAKWSNFSGLTHSIIHGGRDKRKKALAANADVYLMNVEGILTEFNDAFAKWVDGAGRVMLVLDESTLFKNSGSRRFKIIKKFLNLFYKRYILTGTPMPKSIENLFGQIFLLDQGASLGRYITHFRQEYMTLKYDGSWEPMHSALPRIAERIAPFTLQLDANEYLTLPEVVTLDHWVTLPVRAMHSYKELEREFIAELDGATIVAPNAAAALTKLRQVAGGAVYVPTTKDWVHVHRAKLDALTGILEELDGAPMLLFYHYDHERIRIQEAFPGTPAIRGGCSIEEANIQIAMFNAGHLPLLLVHPASMAHGVNLQEGHAQHVCWFGLFYDREQYDQANARVARSGNKSSHVFVHRILATGSVDGVMSKVLECRGNFQEAFCRLIREQEGMEYECE